MHVPGLIEKKRDGGELAANEIQEMVAGFTNGKIPDPDERSPWPFSFAE